MNYIYLGLLAVTGLAACGSGPGLSKQGLAPCPSSPNCISSQSGGKKHAIAPLTYTGTREEAVERIVALVSVLPRTTLITRTPDYLHFEFRSKWMKFTDDVEFWLPEDQPGIVHIRSASRLGYSDMGVNRKRMEQIRDLFEPGGA